MDTTRPGESRGLFSSLRQLATTSVGLLQTRLELAVTELEEERIRLTRIAVLGVAALLFAVFGLAMLTFFVVAAFWDTHRLLVTALVSVAYFGLALVALVMMNKAVREKPPLLATTLAELRKDKAHLADS